MGVARIRITSGMLRELFPLPNTSLLTGSAETGNCGFIEVYVEDDNFPPHEPGTQPPLVMPIFRKNRPVEFVEYRFPERMLDGS